MPGATLARREAELIPRCMRSRLPSGNIIMSIIRFGGSVLSSSLCCSVRCRCQPHRSSVYLVSASLALLWLTVSEEEAPSATNGTSYPAEHGRRVGLGPTSQCSGSYDTAQLSESGGDAQTRRVAERRCTLRHRSGTKRHRHNAREDRMRPGVCQASFWQVCRRIQLQTRSGTVRNVRQSTDRLTSSTELRILRGLLSI